MKIAFLKKNRGIVVPGLGTRRGRRYERSFVQLPRGGKMQKKRISEKMDSPRSSERIRKEVETSVSIT